LAAITVQTVVVTGLVDPTFTAATAAGDTFINNGKTIYVVKNGGGGTINVTFDDTGSVSPTGADAFDPDVTVQLLTTEEGWCGPFPTNRFGTNVTVTMDVDTSVTVAAVSI
jgi:hypothetical protein